MAANHEVKVELQEVEAAGVKRERSPAADVGNGGAAKQARAEVDLVSQVEVPTTEAGLQVTPAQVIVTIDDPDRAYEEDEGEEEDTIFIYRADGSMIPLGMPGEMRSTRIFFASIQADGKSVGKIKAMLMSRPNMQGGFWRACDAESAGLEEIASVLFDQNGLPIYPPLQRVDAEGHPAAGYGGFLYIEHFEIWPASDDLSEERRNEMGTAAIRSLLKLSELNSYWSVAGYICEGNPFPGNRWDLEDRRQRPSCNVIRQRMANDARQFLCAGFREVDEDGIRGMFYITEHMLQAPPLSRAAALTMPLLLTGGKEALAAQGDMLTQQGQQLMRQGKQIEELQGTVLGLHQQITEIAEMYTRISQLHAALLPSGQGGAAAAPSRPLLPAAPLSLRQQLT
jgi:hypothetical protein